MPKRIGLFGGSFDPPHIGHKALVDAALQELNLDEVWIIPVGLPVHRQLSGKASPEQRFSWLNTMFSDDLQVRIVDWEINQHQATPAIATLRRFQAENPSTIPFWLMGMDSFLDMPSWVEYPKHQQLCNLAVFQRKGVKETLETDSWKVISSHQPLTKAGGIVKVSSALPAISATQIRQEPNKYQTHLHQDTCNAILACYASD